VHDGERVNGWVATLKSRWRAAGGVDRDVTCGSTRRAIELPCQLGEGDADELNSRLQNIVENSKRLNSKIKMSPFRLQKIVENFQVKD
jgi:hypothetical protein